MALLNGVTTLVGYVASTFPTIQSNMPQFFTAQFRSIATALASCQNALRNGQLGVTVVSATPTTSNLASGTSGVFKVSGGAVYLAYNDAGTIKKVALT